MTGELTTTRLLCDLMCGGVVTYLRMCGYDTLYAGDRGLERDREVIDVAREEGRTIVTRDVALANRAPAAILLESRDVRAQLRELEEAGIDLSADEPTFCGRCNGPLEPVDRTTSTPEYAPNPQECDVWRCLDCEQYFWRGSHWDRVRETLSQLGSRSSSH